MTDIPTADTTGSVREQVRERYARAALGITDVSGNADRTGAADCCGAGGCSADFGAALYDSGRDLRAAGRGGAGEPGLWQPDRRGRPARG